MYPEADLIGPPRLWRNRRVFQAYPQVAVKGIPPDILPKLQALKFNRGIPISWLAAVCERTGWDPNYQVLNTIARYPQGYTIRQFGIAGIWADIPEITFGTPVPTSACGQTSAGWITYNPPPAYSIYCRCPGIQPVSYYTSIDANLNLATDILLETAKLVKEVCGELNSLMFLRWQLGCRFMPEKDATGRCLPPPNIPDIFTSEMNTLVELQRIYAEKLGEEPIVPSPTPTPAPTPTPGESSILPLLGLLGLVGLIGVVGLAQKRKQGSQTPALTRASYVGETRRASQLPGPGYILLTDSQEVDAVLDHVELPEGWRRSEVTGVIVSLADGDYREVWITDSPRPYSTHALYEKARVL